MHAAHAECSHERIICLLMHGIRNALESNAPATSLAYEQEAYLKVTALFAWQKATVTDHQRRMSGYVTTLQVAVSSNVKMSVRMCK